MRLGKITSGLILGLCVLVMPARASAAVDFGFLILNGPPSGYFQHFRVDITNSGPTFRRQFTSLFYYQNYLEGYYDPDYEIIDTGGQLLDYECYPGVACDGLVKNFIVRPTYTAFTIYSPRSYDDCVLGENPRVPCSRAYDPADMTLVLSGDGDTEPMYALSTSAISAVPEPATWAALTIGFGVIGTALRARNRDGRGVRALRRA